MYEPWKVIRIEKRFRHDVVLRRYPQLLPRVPPIGLRHEIVLLTYNQVESVNLILLGLTDFPVGHFLDNLIRQWLHFTACPSIPHYSRFRSIDPILLLLLCLSVCEFELTSLL